MTSEFEFTVPAQLRPPRFYGTLQDRLEHLDRIKRRCDGNNQHCVNTAVDEYDVLLADGFGVPLPDAEKEIRRSCGKHRAQFLASGRFKVTQKRYIGNGGPDRAV